MSHTFSKSLSLLCLLGLLASLLGCDAAPTPPIDVSTPTVSSATPTATATAMSVPTVACTTPAVVGQLNLLPLPSVVRTPTAMLMFNGRMYVAGSRSNNIGVIENGHLSRAFSVGEGPIALVADEALGKLFVLHADMTLAMSDGQQVQATIPLTNTALASYHQEPHAIIADPQQHRIYVGIHTIRPEIAVIDAQAFTVSARIVFTGSHGIGPMALDTENHHLFFAHDDANSFNISVLDLESQQIVQKITVRNQLAAMLLYDASTHRLYSDYRDGDNYHIAVIENGKEVESLTAAIPPSNALIVGQRLYVSNLYSHTVDVVDLSTRQAVTSIPVGIQPRGLIAAATGERILVAVNGLLYAPEANRLEVIDTKRNEVVDRIPLAAQATQLIGDATRRRLYALLPSSNEVVISDGGRVLARVPLEGAPFHMALDEAAGRLYVTDFPARLLSVIDVNDGRVVARVTPLIPPDAYGEFSSRPNTIAVDPLHQHLLINGYIFPLASLNATGRYTITGSPFFDDAPPKFFLASASVPRYYGISGTGLKISHTLLAVDSDTLKRIYLNTTEPISALVLDERAQRLYATTELPGPVARTPFVLQVHDALTLNLLISLNLPTHVTALALNADTHHLFLSYWSFAGLASAADNTVDVLDTRTLGRVASLRVSAEPIAMMVLGDHVYIASSTSPDLLVVRDCALPAPPAPTATP